jgi:ATP-binding cassette subfamily B protein
VNLLHGVPALWSLIVIGLVVAAIGLVMWFSNLASRRLITRAIADVVAKLALDAYQAAVEHDLSFFDEFSSGKVVSRITSDTRDFGDLIGLVTDVAAQFVEAFILAIVIFNIEWKLTLYIMALIPIVLVFAILYRTLARNVTRQGMRAMANVNSTIKETVSGIAVAKNFRQEASIYKDFDNANTTSYRVNVKRGLVLSIVFPALNALQGLATAFMVYIGGMTAVQGLVSVGSWYLFLLSLDRFLFPVMNLTSFWTNIQNGLSASERVFALIDTPNRVIQSANNRVSHLNGEIVFDHVDFRYKESEPILQDFSLKVAAGVDCSLLRVSRGSHPGG